MADEIRIVRGLTYNIDIEFVDKNNGGAYAGTALTSQTIISARYNDPGDTTNWVIAGTFTHVSGNTFRLSLTDVETNQTEDSWSIAVTADEIQSPHYVFGYFDDPVPGVDIDPVTNESFISRTGIKIGIGL